MPTFPFSILSPRGKSFEGTVTAVSAPGAAGGFGILAGHAPMIAAVQAGLTSVNVDDRMELFYTGEGVMEVSHHEAILLVDEAEKVDGSTAASELLQKRRDRLAAAKEKK